MAAVNNFYNPYDSEDWDSDDDWEAKDCRDLSIDDAREIAEHLKQNRRIAPYMFVLQRSKVRKELLFTTELGTAVARHMNHEGCGELVRETLKRLVFISKGLPDDVNDKFDERHGARIKKSKEQKRSSISPNSGAMTDSSEDSPASMAEKKSLLKASIRKSTETSSKTNHSTKALTTFKQVQKEVQKREKEAEKAAKAEAKLADQKRKADASSEGSSAKIVKVEPTTKKKKVVPSFESLEVLHAYRVMPKALITSAEESKAKVQGVDDAVMNNLIAIQGMIEKKAAAKKKQQVVDNSMPDSQHLTMKTLAAKIRNAIPNILSHSDILMQKELEEFKLKLDADKMIWEEKKRQAEMKEEMVLRMEDLENGLLGDVDRLDEAADWRQQEEIRPAENVDHKREENRCHVENRPPLKPVNYKTPPSSLVKLTIFSPQKSSAQPFPLNRQLEQRRFAPVQLTVPSPTIPQPKLMSAEVVAQHLQALPIIPEPEHFRHLLKTLTADVLSKAETLVGRQMGRVDRIWWELLFRDFGRPTQKFTAPIRELYQDHVKAAKRNQLEEDKKRAQFNNASMFLPPPPPPPFQSIY